MPKTYPKTQPKKTRPKKNQPKAQPRPVNLMARKSYWITLTVITIVFIFAYGYLTKISVEKDAITLSTVLLLIGFAFNIGYKPSRDYNKRATFMFVGASIVGFSIWVAVVFSLNATGLHSQIANAIGDNFFAITSLIICLISGAFIGDLIGKNRKAIELLANKFRN